MLIMRGVDSARESLPRVGGGAERSEAEGMLETKESVIKLSSWRVFCHTENCSNYKIDVTEKLSRNLTSATDWFKADKNSCLY